MGYYINPQNEDKVDFIQRVGTPVDPDDIPEIDIRNDDTAYCCLKVNGGFNALGILVSDNEKYCFNDPADPRPTRFFSVPKSEIIDDSVSDLSRYL